MQRRLAISMGDFNGIGPEIILKSVEQIMAEGATPVLIGHQNIFQYYAALLDQKVPDFRPIHKPEEISDGKVNILNLEGLANTTPGPGHFTKASGAAAMQAVAKGTQWCLKQHTHALVTAPISKEAINKAGYHYPGHTEFLAEKTDTTHFMMILVHEALRVGLVTIHEPVARVADLISRPKVAQNINIMHRALTHDFGLQHPRLAVLGLNPHAGDGGVIGREEIEIIQPVIDQFKKDEEVEVKGPFPADGFFGNKKYEAFDGVLAMYHDQGLVPFKTLSFGGGVNVTAGLPIVRTSPDHGTAFDIAGKDRANPSSFSAAVKLALKLSRNRFKDLPHAK